MTLAEAYEQYLAAVCAGDRRRAFETVERARAANLGVHAIYLEVFQPTLREIGRLWQENLLSVAEEHLATAITLAAMLRLSAETQLGESGRTLIAACSDTERHEIGLRMICDFMDLEGWETIFLGPSVPMESLQRMVQDRQPDVVALSASILPHLPQVRATIAGLRAAAGAKQPLFLVGGRPFLADPQLVDKVGADLTAKDAAEAVALLKARFP